MKVDRKKYQKIQFKARVYIEGNVTSVKQKCKRFGRGFLAERMLVADKGNETKEVGDHLRSHWAIRMGSHFMGGGGQRELHVCKSKLLDNLKKQKAAGHRIRVYPTLYL